MENRAGRPVHLEHRRIGAPEGTERLPRVVEFVNLVRRSGNARTAAVRLRKLLWGLDYHFQDAGEYSLDGRTWRRRERGTVHLYAPETRYWERWSDADTPFTETYIIFQADDIPELESAVSAGRGFARFVDSAGLVRGVFTELLEGAGRGREYWQAQSALYRVLSLLSSAEPRGPGEYLLSGISPVPALLSERVDAHIREHYHERLTLEGIARAMGVSRSTLTHRYHGETGATPMARLTECRLNVAAGMILRGEPLKAIASHTGFYDEFHFSNAFRRRFGVPPRQYARREALGRPRFVRPASVRVRARRRSSGNDAA
jgi:AraC-like DNA-binding protein